MADDLFDDDDGSPVATEERPAWAAPEGAAAPAERPQSQWVERARLKWDTMSRGQKVAAVVVAGVAVMAAWGYWGGRGGKAEDAATTPTSVVSQTVQTSPPSTQPPRQLVEKAAERPRDDVLRGLPDLHPMVVAFAGGSPDSFSNAVRVAMAGGVDPCSLFFGVDPKGWRVVPAQPDVAYPNDFFPVRVFQGYPCGPSVGNPDPIVVPTTTVKPA